jgi:tripartite-type tricarboxylate transporter receptor subunit TctC
MFRFYRQCALFVFAVTFLSGAAVHACAETFPNRSVRLIVPFAPGGLNDVVARLVQPHLENSLGQPVVVENRPAASGIVGTDFVAKAIPDGHTLLVLASSHTVTAATRSKLPYDAERDLAPLALLGKSPLLFVTTAALPAKSLNEFVALAKAEPGKFNYATPGTATTAHLVSELFMNQAGIKMQHIPYRGGAPAVLAVSTGEAQFAAVSPLVSLPQIEAGTLRVLAVGSPARNPQFPDVPAVAETLPGFEAIQWVGMLTTGGTPKNVVERLNTELNRALRNPDVIAKLAAQGIAPAGGTPEEFQNLISTEIHNWTTTAHTANIKGD